MHSIISWEKKVLGSVQRFRGKLLVNFDTFSSPEGKCESIIHPFITGIIDHFQARATRQT